MGTSVAGGVQCRTWDIEMVSVRVRGSALLCEIMFPCVHMFVMVFADRCPYMCLHNIDFEVGMNGSMAILLTLARWASSERS